jgi:hypothetical protein
LYFKNRKIVYLKFAIGKYFKVFTILALAWRDCGKPQYPHLKAGNAEEAQGLYLLTTILELLAG